MGKIKIDSLKAAVISKLSSDSFMPLDYFQQYLLVVLGAGKKPVTLDDYDIQCAVLDTVCARIRAWDIRCMRSFLTEFDRWLPSGLNVNTFKGVDLVEDDWVVFW